MRRVGIFFLLIAAIAGLAALGRAVMVASPLARLLVVTREENPTAGIELAAEAPPLAEPGKTQGERAAIKELWEDADFLALGPDERLAAVTGEALRLMYEVDGRELEQARMLDVLSKYVTQPYFDHFVRVYSEKLTDHQRQFLEYEFKEIWDETVRDAWGEYQTRRNVLAGIRVSHDGQILWIMIKCIFKETGDAHPLDQAIDQILYVAG
jgi:hypothetical protein